MFNMPDNIILCLNCLMLVSEVEVPMDRNCNENCDFSNATRYQIHTFQSRHLKWIHNAQLEAYRAQAQVCHQHSEDYPVYEDGKLN